MKLRPYAQVDEVSFQLTPADALARYGRPVRRSRNGVGLNELDYGARVLRFQDGGRLEEVTQRAPVLYVVEQAVVPSQVIDLPFGRLHSWVRREDGQAFARAGFVISPRLGLAFVPGEPDWVTALAAHCIDTWRQLSD